VVREVIDQHGRLDILVNNAGITIDRTVAKMSGEDWQRVLAVNLSGAFFIAQAALDHMIERGTGRIISVSSVIGETGNIGQANYAASKSGLFGLAKSLARGGRLPAEPRAAARRRRDRRDGKRGNPGLHRYGHDGDDPG
jgi:acetoacetyl-CoA reductase/3-oxoacyl-[acyl-carrier protein] reductase